MSWNGKLPWLIVVLVRDSAFLCFSIPDSTPQARCLDPCMAWNTLPMFNLERPRELNGTEKRDYAAIEFEQASTLRADFPVYRQFSQ